ncbi:MAG: glycosyltransferase family 2 protein [Planctomycetota bacterium]
MAAISVVTVVWNNRAGIAAFLDSVTAPNPHHDVEIVVVDNGSDDGSVEYLRTRDDITLIENGVNVGYPVAMNRGVEFSSGDYVVMSTDDLQYAPGALDAMVAQLELDPGLGGVAPVVEVPGDPARLYPLMTTDTGLYYGWNFFSGFMLRFPDSARINHNQVRDSADYASDLPWLHGCSGMFRREALQQVGGGFDERFFMYFEDADLGRSLRKLGWRLRLANEARVLHHEQQVERQRRSPTRVFFMESWHKYHRKHSSWPFRCAAFVVVLAALALQVTVQCLRAVCGRPHSLGVMMSYLTTHVSVVLRNLEREREREILDHKTRWNPLPAATADPATPPRPATTVSV